MASLTSEIDNEFPDPPSLSEICKNNPAEETTWLSEILQNNYDNDERKDGDLDIFYEIPDNEFERFNEVTEYTSNSLTRTEL